MWLNKLYCGDNIEVLKRIPAESVDLIYIDPPFFSNKHYEIIWGNGAELRSFEDHWKGGIDHYVNWMSERLELLHKILKPSGSIYVHLDWHAVHYIKIEMDKIFGSENFLNHIVWSYKRWPSPSKKYQRMHDDILFYCKDNKNTSRIFNKEYEEISESTKKMFKGKRQVLLPCATKKVTIDKPAQGVPMRDVWYDIQFLAGASKERLGYPTQKPETLLERIIRTSTNKGDVVLDAFCGCGTTIAAAEKLDRKWIAIDVSPIAVKVITERLKMMENKMGKKVEDFITYGLPKKTIAQVKNLTGFEFQDWIIEQIEGIQPKRKVNDKGIDGKTKDGIPIQVKRSEKVGRIVVDNFFAALDSIDAKKGKIYAFSFGRGAWEKVAELKRKKKMDIELITIKDLLIEKYGDHTHHE